MEHRGHPRSDARRAKDREDNSRCQDRGYPPADPREWERSWGHADPRYRHHMTSPRIDPYSYGPQHYAYGYGWAEQPRPQSRHGYDYNPWDYRENYGYYEQDYYSGQHRPRDGGQWEQQEGWKRDHYQDKKDHSTSTEGKSYNQRKDSSQQYKADYVDTLSKDNGENSFSNYLGTLESSKNSGLSSSSSELSLYINAAEQSDPSQSLHPAYTEPNTQLSAPLKYSIPHAVVSFGPTGQLIRVSPGFSTQRNVSQLEIHSLEVILNETQEQQEMRTFPGPLTRDDLHKVDAIEFAQQMAGVCLRDDKLHDMSSAALLWNLLTLLCRQNGQMVGSDMAELLVQGSRSSGSSSSASLIDFSEGGTSEAPPCEGEDDLLTGNSHSSENAQRALRSYTQLLLAGRKKDALEAAMSSGLWGHALFLASKMDNRSYTTVLNRFTGQLTANDPLQTLFQLLSGRIPAVATCCGSEKWGDWRPHLAVILSNETGDSAVKQKAISTMGDTLASRGLLHSAHVCYLTAGVSFAAFTQKDERLVLLGSSHRLPFRDFATNSAIRCTELYEYCQNLGGKYFSIPSFQVYKFLYAIRLLDCGLVSQAFHYCEVVGQAILRQNQPLVVLTDLLLKLSDQLRHSEGSYNDAPDQEPGWMTQLRFRHNHLQTGSDCFSEIHQPPPVSTDDYSPVQSPAPELLYYRDTEENTGDHVLDSSQEMASPGRAGVCDWPQDISPVPALDLSVAVGQQHSPYNTHNTDSPGVASAPPYCPVYSPLAAQETAPLSGLSTIGSPLRVGGQQTQHIMNHSSIERDMSDSNSTPKLPSSKSETSAGWFSGWFKSKPKDDQSTCGQTSSPQTVNSWDKNHAIHKDYCGTLHVS